MMVADFDLELKGADIIIKKLGLAPQFIQRWSLGVIEHGLSIYEAGVVSRSPVGATGHLKQGWTVDIDSGPLQVEGRVVNMDNEIKVRTMESGRSAGAAMPPWGPGSALDVWVRRMIGSDGVESGLTFVIARAIARKGIQAKNFVKDTKAHDGPVVRAYIASQSKRLEGLLR